MTHGRQGQQALWKEGYSDPEETEENQAGAASRGRLVQPEFRRSPPGCLKNQSVLRAFSILKAFHHPEEWVTAGELSRRAEIHEATLHRFVHSLMDVGALIRNGKGEYRCVLFVMPGTHGGAHRGNSR